MNTKTATYNATDVYETWVDNLLKENKTFWTRSSLAKKRKREFIFTKNNKVVGSPIEVMSFTRWYKIVSLYFLLARKEVIKGRRIRLGYRLGAIRARTISRNFKNKQINWNETKKQPLVLDPVTKKMKRQRIIYHTSETYSRIAWEKLGSITNETYYKFVPSQGTKARGGFKQEFKTALKENPLLETQYKQCINELI